ncbi:LacI family DNA-binding transcriptional regulator [Catellatospora sp. KI3]|uniref:LacI family DNA-binding transcriptional regulator n=1 Tax=Catellatospora sp. KI3 TaxID=3041620 RepID=UPI0024824E6C|nr:LacI family DNA-binding transcriptional regulator [Catellatospora sp. KI3]MDI1463313.1 LacI family DNA-binding transcriptional regulator [Catellatospora sp. KI3]
MTGAARRRVTQQDIARMTGVSQATVSLVLNGRAEDSVKLSAETRERVLRAIAETGYVADPIARRLAARHNRILGVFTYEPVFPSANSDFYHPFLVGIEQQAEQLGCDLLLLTSAPVVDGQRRIFHQDNRLRLADGSILLGRSLDRSDLARLLAEEVPFVSIGRRDDAGGPVPSVGADYPAAVAVLVRRAVELGHERLAYLGQGAGPESWADRMRGFRTAVAGAGVTGVHYPTREPSGTPAEATEPGPDLAAALDAALAAGVTAVLAEEHADGVALHELARSRGVRLSIATLGEPTRAAPATETEFTSLRIPRQAMGAQAVEVLMAVIEGTPGPRQRLLPCEVVPGTTLIERGI